jgi:hypothetical protein
VTLQRRLLVCVTVLAFGCGTSDVTAVRPYDGGRLPRPRSIVVYDFETAGADITLAGKERSRADAGRSVAHRLSLEVVEELEDLGIPAERRTGDFEVPSDSFAIHGQLVLANEGSAWKRGFVGFGYGKSEVRTVARLLRHDAGGAEVIAEYDTEATSGRKPGVLTTLPIGMAVQGVSLMVFLVSGAAAGIGELNASLGRDAKRTAKEWVGELEDLFEEHGWLD